MRILAVKSNTSFCSDKWDKSKRGNYIRWLHIEVVEIGQPFTVVQAEAVAADERVEVVLHEGAEIKILFR
jgi:hypothetical protein